jgi:hypothetical protein
LEVPDPPVLLPPPLAAPSPATPEPVVPAPPPPAGAVLLVPGVAVAPAASDWGVAPGPAVVPVPAAPMLLPLRFWSAVDVELGLLAAPPLVSAVPDMGGVDWHPAASTAAIDKLSKAAGRWMDLKGMCVPRWQSAKVRLANQAIGVPESWLKPR